MTDKLQLISGEPKITIVDNLPGQLVEETMKAETDQDFDLVERRLATLEKIKEAFPPLKLSVQLPDQQ